MCISFGPLLSRWPIHLLTIFHTLGILTLLSFLLLSMSGLKDEHCREGFFIGTAVSRHFMRHPSGHTSHCHRHGQTLFG
jgi:hypothetical protein